MLNQNTLYWLMDSFRFFLDKYSPLVVGGQCSIMDHDLLLLCFRARTRLHRSRRPTPGSPKSNGWRGERDYLPGGMFSTMLSVINVRERLLGGFHVLNIRKDSLRINVHTSATEWLHICAIIYVRDAQRMREKQAAKAALKEAEAAKK